MSNETTAGPYTVDLSGHWVMTNIGTYREVEHFDLPSQAKIVCEELNTAYAAGQASREQWISVDERLPIEEKWVLVIADGAMNCAWYNDQRGWDNGFNERPKNIRIEEITHWMPLPSPPNK